MRARKSEWSTAREADWSSEEFSVAFRMSPTKHARLRGLKRNAAVVLGNVGTSGGHARAQRAVEVPEPLMREYAAWTLERLRR